MNGAESFSDGTRKTRVASSIRAVGPARGIYVQIHKHIHICTLKYSYIIEYIGIWFFFLSKMPYDGTKRYTDTCWPNFVVKNTYPYRKLKDFDRFHFIFFYYFTFLLYYLHYSTYVLRRKTNCRRGRTYAHTHTENALAAHVTNIV